MHPPNIHSVDNASITLIVFIDHASIPNRTHQRSFKFLRSCNNMLRGMHDFDYVGQADAEHSKNPLP